MTAVTEVAIVHNKTIVAVRLLRSWYRKQTMQAKWGTNYSSPFTVTNKVRQEEVLTPYLFAVYLNELSDQLGSDRVRCTVGNMAANSAGLRWRVARVA